MRKVTGIWLMDHALSLQEIKRLKEQANGIPLIIDCSKDEFLAGIREKTLHGGVMYNLKARNISDANLIVKKARAYKT